MFHYPHVLPAFDAAIARLFLVLLLTTMGKAAEIHPPIGAYVGPSIEELSLARNFGTNDPVVLTSYFYWYDIYSGAHIVNSDGTDALTDHPPTLTGFSYRSSSWHKRQLQDMIDAGIDVLLPVYWGEPSQRIVGRPVAEQPWSFAGLPPLVEARQALLREGANPPAIGMFYDTSTLQYNSAGRQIDLTTDSGRRWFYESIRDFFSLIPARHWATIEGKPIIFLYSASFAAAHDQTCIDYVRQEFRKDFSGREPYIVREISWNVRADNTYAWGGAISLRNPGVAALGPGYDHSAVPGRDPLIVPREDGVFFERNWIRFLRAPSPLVHVETWNEYHEGTDIAASKEYGRKYIELNRKYADMFKAGIKPPRPRGPFSDYKSVSVRLQATNDSQGLEQFDFADGATTPAEKGGSSCRAVAATVHAGKYVYFQIHDSYKWADKMLVDVEVEYFDEGSGSFRIEYDGPDPNAPFNGAYTPSRNSFTLGTSREWNTAKFRLIDAKFLNSQNGGADFRLAVQAPTLYVRKLTVTRLGMPSESGASLRGWQQDFADPLGTNWMIFGDSNAFEQGAGMLRTVPGAGGDTRLLAHVVEPDSLVPEILARVRYAAAASDRDSAGGILFSAEPVSGAGYRTFFHIDSTGPVVGIRSSGSEEEVSNPLLWELNRWYWVRLRHTPNNLSGYPDLRLRVWPADGETPEPSSWTAWLDYFPRKPIVLGAPGIAAGAERLDIDFLFLKQEELPAITVRPPSLKPARAFLIPVAASQDFGLQLKLQGDPETTYLLERSNDLLTWSATPLVTDPMGSVLYNDDSRQLRCFYRARSVQ